jgi:hypothetical protein
VNRLSGRNVVKKLEASKLNQAMAIGRLKAGCFRIKDDLAHT